MAEDIANVHLDLRLVTDFIADKKARKWRRRGFLRDMTLAVLSGAASPLYAQRAGMVGVVEPPTFLGDFPLADQNGRKRRLNDYLLQSVTAPQTIYTGCGSVPSSGSVI